MTEPAVWARLFQFQSGPEKHKFYACAKHKDGLKKPPMCFMVIPESVLEAVDPEDELTCDICLGEDGP